MIYPLMMRPIYSFGRACLRGRIPHFTHLSSQSQSSLRRFGASAKHHSQNPFSYPPRPRYGRTILLAAVGATALSPAVFVALSEKDNGGTSQTGEGRMLAASREEMEKKLSDDDVGLSRIRHGIVLFLDVYIWEPICTGFRFVHLLLIFVPVIVSVPSIWIGRRHPDQDNERTGTLWWYNFLVKSMERAGPAFIKVPTPPRSHTQLYTQKLTTP